MGTVLILLQDPNVQWVLVGAVLLGFSCATIGCFGYLRRESLVGDMLAHAALPGVTTAFLITESRSIGVLSVGAILSCYLAKFLYRLTLRWTTLSPDAVTALLLSVSFGVGLVQISLIQRGGSGAASGIDRLIFGQAAALGPDDVHILILLAIAVLVVVLPLVRRFELFLFDPTHASVVGMRLPMYEVLMSVLTVSAVVAGLQLVGVVLVAALLIIPAAAARPLVNRFPAMLMTAGVCGALGAGSGVLLSLLFDSLPTGPCIVLVLGGIFGVSILCSPHRGIVARAVRRRWRRQRLDEENVIRTLFKVSEHQRDGAAGSSISEVRRYRTMDDGRLRRALRALETRGLIVRSTHDLRLTEEGRAYGEELTRRHRLWEAYLSAKIQVPPDHVHDDAEELEHFLTPEIEEQVRAELRGIASDPHGKPIPSGPRGES